MAIDEKVSLLDVDVCRPERCPGCDPQRDCVVVAVSDRLTAVGPFLYVNKHGGDLDQWDDGITLANWTNAGENANGVLCLGDFVLIMSETAAGVYYSDDLGVNLIEHTETAWGTNGPYDADGIDQSFIVMVHKGGRVWGTYDVARTWELLDDGHATSSNLLRVMIARDNPQVIYAVGAANSLIKTENGGQNWFALAGPSGGTDIMTALWVKDQFHVLIGDDDGQIHETSDGGENWTTQDALPDLGAVPVVRDIVGCGCDGLFAAVGHSGGTMHRIYRNVDGGASGRWYVPDNMLRPTYEPAGIACCDINRAIIVGGDGTSNGNVILLA